MTSAENGEAIRYGESSLGEFEGNVFCIILPASRYTNQLLREKQREHKQYIAEHGEDMSEIRNWEWRG